MRTQRGNVRTIRSAIFVAEDPEVVAAVYGLNVDWLGGVEGEIEGV